TIATASLRELNRWTLARQLLLDRAGLDAVTAVERLAGMQAQHPASPYVGLWSRLRDFRLPELEADVLASPVVKATLLRGTLPLASARESDLSRVACRVANPYLARAERELEDLGADVDAVRAELLAVLRERPLGRTELLRAAERRLPAGLPPQRAFDALHL